MFRKKQKKHSFEWSCQRFCFMAEIMCYVASVYAQPSSQHPPARNLYVMSPRHAEGWYENGPKAPPLTNSHQISRSIGIFRGLRLASPCWNHWMWISGFLHQPSPNLAIPPLEDRITLKHSFSAKMVELISAASCWMIWMRIRIWIWAQHLWIVKAISG